MTETVVDDLEAVEVEIERRESAAAGPFFELVEAAPEPLHENRAVAQPGQRIEESGAARAAPVRLARSVVSVSDPAMRAERRPAPRTATPRHRNRR